MHLIIDNILYEVVINRKPIKHTYIRVKDGKIYINTSKLTSNKTINKILNQEVNNIKKMIKKEQNKKNKNNYLLGHPIDIVIISNLTKPKFDNNKIYLKDMKQLEPFYKNLALNIYQERLDKIYNDIEEKIPYPVIKIRKMKTRWGVCNRKTNTITLNLELIKYDYKYIDYVIFHELCHFIHFNHSLLFWEMVLKYVPNYKKLRKELRN